MYEGIVEKWDNDDCLKEILPDTYEEIKAKLEALKAGVPYKIYDATDTLKDMIMDMGAKIRDTQKLRGNKTLGSENPCSYEYKTNIPTLVDNIIERRLYENRKC